MAKRLPPHFVDLVYQAALKSFWRKKTLRRFLQQCGIAEPFLSTWAPEESKRDLLDRLFASLERQPERDAVLKKMARGLAEQTSYPDLENWEDSAQKIAAAKEAVAQLHRMLQQIDHEVTSEEDRAATQRRFREHQQAAREARENLDKLSGRLEKLSTEIGSQKAGYDFQDWFFDLADYFEIVNRRPYSHKGRQIDGSLTIGDTTYLVELKFTAEQAGANDIDSILKKIRDKADNTMGIMVSVSGYSTVAVDEASGPGTPLLLLDHRHLFLALGGTMSLSEIVERVRRHASQTGESFLRPEDFGR